MKSNIFILFALFIHQIGFAQNIEQCTKVVEKTITAINNKSSDVLEPHLAEDFILNGITGVKAKMVVKPLFTQLDETINIYDKISEEKTDNTLTLVYKIQYQKLGKKNATFIFNANNELVNLNLFEMQVKTMKGDAKVKKSDQKITTIPFDIAENLIAVDVWLNGEKRKFILDTGAPKVILNSKHITQNEGKKNSFSTAKGVGGNISGMDIHQIESLDFAGIKLENEDLLTMDLAHLEEELETEFYGLIGYELVKEYDLLFDYQKQELTIINPDNFEEFKKDKLANKELTSIPFILSKHIPIVEGVTADRSLAYGVDSGAGTNLLDDDLFAPMKKSLKKIGEDDLTGADNRMKVVKKGLVKSTAFGTKYFKKLDTVFSDISHLNEGYKVQLDGILGYPVLSKQPTLLSYKRKELIFIN